MDNKENLKRKTKPKGRPRKRSKESDNAGRARVSVEEASRSTVYRRARELLENNSYNLAIIELAARISKDRAAYINEQVNPSENDELRHTKESALAFYLEHDYSKSRYVGLVKDSRSRNCAIYPAYQSIREAMTECQPQNYRISEIQVIVPLQDMLNKTAERLCSAVAVNWDQHNLLHLKLIVTLGFDSSSGHTNPHQQYENTENEAPNAQHSLFVSSMIIIQLNSDMSDECSWVNPTPQSIRFCRPLRIAVEKEDDSTIIREYNRLNKEINDLVAYKFKLLNKKTVKIKFEVSQTLFDGKCINTIVGNRASSTCPLCLRTSHNFGKLTDNFQPKQSSLKFGLGLLHDEIRAFEHLLHISNRQTLKTWDIRKHLREQFEEIKISVQKTVYKEIGVRVDQILQGHGTTNTGNLARRCFKNPVIFAQALNLDHEFVTRIATILSAFKCKKRLKLNELEKFCWETYCLYYTLFPWARMSPTVHKLLKHGCDIAREFPLPIAYYSEDANEAWHKLYRKNMTAHSRQNSRKNRMIDVFNRAIYLTDPAISLILIEDRKKSVKTNHIQPDIKRFVEESEMTEGNGSDSDLLSD